MSGSQNAPFTIGRNISVVVLWQGTRVDLSKVVEFRSNQEVKRQRSDPLNGLPYEFTTPSGWRGTIMVDRANNAIDVLVATIEAAFWNAGTIGSGSIYAYITNPDGTQSCFEYVGVSFELSDAGGFQQENIVKQSIAFFASQRVQIS